MNNNLPPHISKYINKYAFPKYKVICSNNQKMKIAVVIPAINEFENIKKLLLSLSKNNNIFFGGTMVLFVVNNLTSSSTETKVKNKQTIELLSRLINRNPANAFENKIIKSQLNIAFIDAATGGNELEEKHGGVGLARKIGMDAVLNYFDYNSEEKNAIVCLDADCTVDSNYFSTIYDEFSAKKYSAGYVNFKHLLPESVEQQHAIINYEIFLRYYVLGLTFAKSPFAFHSIGSTMICDTDSYVKVGGMNKKKAAEDFYFMEKLAKISSINRITKTTVYPSGRGSWRVPFGTGQRVNRFLEHSQNEYLLYSPVSFIVLKEWLEIYHSSNDFVPEQILQKTKAISVQLYNFLIANNFVQVWGKILKNTKSKSQLYKQKLIWFDGFKTLKLIHFLRDNEFPQINMFAAVNLLFDQMEIVPIKDKTKNGKVPDVRIQIQYLEKLREIA